MLRRTSAGLTWTPTGEILTLSSLLGLPIRPPKATRRRVRRTNRQRRYTNHRQDTGWFVALLVTLGCTIIVSFS